MAAAGVRPCANCSLRRRSSVPMGSYDRNPLPMTISSCSSRPTNSNLKISMSSRVGLASLPKQERRQTATNSEERMDVWMRESAAEIVKRLQESPLLVQVFADKSGTGRRLTAERAEEDDWPAVRKRWEKGEAPIPDGVILVDQIEAEEEKGEDSFGAEACRAWGIVVQGRGEECHPSCYLLKTSRVGGIGHWCTHFCLVPVKSFRETAASQLTNCWLLEGM